jgi:purine-binding chemotaxis protein CheW
LPTSVFGGRPALFVGVSNSVCALPLTHVIETMRPLPIETIAGAPPYVCGASIVRGVATPVVDLGLVLGIPEAAARRFVTLRLGTQSVAVTVGTVLGVRDLDQCKVEDLAPLLRSATQETIESIGVLDAQMLRVLRSSWTLPDEVWRSLAKEEKPQ